MKKIVYTLVLCFVLFSCKEEAKKTIPASKDATEQIAANLKSIEVEIEGMTCEIGCARLIQSKLSKVDGVTYTKVSFESGKGQFTFDSNVLSDEDISKKISNIAGGDLYSVVGSKELPEILKYDNKTTEETAVQ